MAVASESHILQHQVFPYNIPHSHDARGQLSYCRSQRHLASWRGCFQCLSHLPLTVLRASRGGHV